MGFNLDSCTFEFSEEWNCQNYKAFKKIIEKRKKMKYIVHLLETKGALNFSFIVIAF